MSSRPMRRPRKASASASRGAQANRNTAANRPARGRGGSQGRSAAVGGEVVIDGGEQSLEIVQLDFPHVADAEGCLAQRAVAGGDGHVVRRQMRVERGDIGLAGVDDGGDGAGKGGL